MGLRFIIVCVFTAALVTAQSISITSPTPGQAISGFAGFRFAVSVSSAPAAHRVCYTVDAYPMPDVGPACSFVAPWSLSWNTYGVLNGSHQVVATLYDGAGNVLAASPAQPFTVANPWPCSWTPGLTVATGTALTATWSGQVSITPTVSGSSSGDNKQFLWFIDGVQQHSQTSSLASLSISVDTTRWNNGPHVVAVRVDDMGTSCTTYSDSYEGAIGEWSATVTFGNGATVMELWENAHEVFLAPTNTFTLHPSLINTDGTTASSPTFDYYSQNTAVATVGSASGSSTVVTAVATGNAQVRTMAETITGTDAISNAVTAISGIQSASHPALDSYNGEVLNVKSSTGGWVAGLYEIAGIDVKNNILHTNGTPCPSAVATPCTGGSFAFGPSRTTWIMVAPTNVLPHFGMDGTILTAYDPARSFFMHEAFRSGDGFADQAYTSSVPNANALLGYGDDYLALGFNTVEVGALTNSETMAETNQTNFRNNQNNYMTSNAAMIAPWPNLRLFGIMDMITTDHNTWTGSSASFSPPAVQTIFQSMRNTNLFVGTSLADEVNDKFNFANLQGPISFATSPAQFGLTSIAASGGTCTVNTPNGWAFGFGGPSAFLIHGATTSGFNSAVGSTYSPSSSTHLGGPASYTFSCPSVADGTYNNSTDPGLMIEPYARQGWFGTNYIPYTAWQLWRGWQTAVTKFTLSTGSVAADCPVSFPCVANWGGNGQQSLGTVTNVADWADFYWSHSTYENYLSNRASTWNLISDSPTYTNSIELAIRTRELYGSGFNPAKPLTLLTNGTCNVFGWQGYTIPVATCANDVCTFSSPHNIPVVIPGATRLWISGASNSAYNTNFYVNSILSPTQLSVSLAAADFNPGCTGSGGTLTFANGGTKTISSICSSGNKSSNGGDTLTYAGSADNNVPRHRGQTFTLSGVTGTGSATWNSRVFFYSLENLDLAQDGNGSPSSAIYYRELPTGSSTGGTATLVADNLFVKGRNGSKVSAANSGGGQTSLWFHPGFAFVNVIEEAILRAAGQRFYQMDWGWQTYNPHAFPLSNGQNSKGGWLGLGQATITKFQDNTVTVNQLTSNPHFENGLAAPTAHAAGQANLVINANAKYILQPALNSPDYGDKLDCAARAGSYGDILMCVNGTDGPQTRTFNLSPYLQAGQQIIRYVVTWQSIVMTLLPAGTAGDTVSLGDDTAVFYVFPAIFSNELQEPEIIATLGDIPNASKIAVRYGYDRYFLDGPATNVFSCGAGPCLLPVNRNIGPVYYRLIYMDSSSRVLAISDVQTL